MAQKSANNNGLRKFVFSVQAAALGESEGCLLMNCIGKETMVMIGGDALWWVVMIGGLLCLHFSVFL